MVVSKIRIVVLLLFVIACGNRVTSVDSSSVGTTNKLMDILNDIKNDVMDEDDQVSIASGIDCEVLTKNPNYIQNRLTFTSFADACDDVPAEMIKNVLSVGAAALAMMVNPVAGLIIGIGAGIGSSAFDISCAEESSVESLKAYTYRKVKTEQLKVIKAELKGLSEKIDSNFSYVKVSVLLRWVGYANTVEVKAKAMGLNGIHLMAAAASTKFRLLAWAHNLATSSQETTCQEAAKDVKNNVITHLKRTRKRFQELEDIFKTYHDSTTVVVGSHYGAIKTCQSCWSFWCTSYNAQVYYYSFTLGDGDSKGENVRNFEGSKGLCVGDAKASVTKDGELKKKETFDKMHAALWTPEVTYFQERINCMLAKMNGGVQCNLPKYSESNGACDDTEFETRTIKNEADCRSAALQFGYQFNNAFPQSNSPQYGCFYRRADKDVLFEYWSKDDPSNDWSKFTQDVHSLCYGGGY